MAQSHGSNLWTEPAGNGGTPTALALLLRADGSNWIWDTTGPEEGKFIVYRGDGNAYFLSLLTPRYIVESGSNLALSATGPADMVLADGGSGNLALSANASAITAELMDDPNGNVVMVLRSHNRLDAVRLRVNAYTY